MIEFKDYYGTHMKFDEYPSFGVLSDVKVLVTGTNIAGPYAACIMAEMGAKVIQVEPPNAPCQTRGNYGYSQDHRNTFSITLDTRSEKGIEVLEKLIERTDIWIESGRPGTYDRTGLSDKRMWEINEKLAIVHVSGYGQYGPDKDKAAYDVSGQAMSGYMYMNGASPTSPPLKVSPYLSDYVTAMNACICALSLLTHARSAGKGDSADVSQYESMFRILSSYPADWFNRGYPKPSEPVPYRSGNVHEMAAGFSFYDCKDGGTIFIGMVGAGNVKRGYPLVGLPEPGTGDPDFPEGLTGSLKSLPRAKKIEAAISKFCAERTVDEVEAILNEHGIPNQKAYGPADIEKDPHFAARENIIEWTDSIYGNMRGVGITNKITNNPSKIVASAPVFGEHGAEVLASLGYSKEEIKKMYENGVTRTMDAKESAKHWFLKEWGFFWDKERQAKKLELD